MTQFEWTDRYGKVHQLASPALIDSEITAIGEDIDSALNTLADAVPAKQTELRAGIRGQISRLEQLQSDAERWNAHANTFAKIEAVALAEDIRRLVNETEIIRVIALLHSQHEDLIADDEHRSALLAGDATRAQKWAIRHSSIEPKPASDATRGQAHEWLKGDPAFFRPRTDDGGWFEWRDDTGALNRLASPLQIELEIASLVSRASQQSSQLTSELPHNETARAIEAVNSLSERLSVLRTELERFVREAEQREDDEWQTWIGNWRKSRSDK